MDVQTVQSVRTEYSRSELVEICRQALVPQSKWHNRDSHEAQKQAGACLVLLLAGCEFYIRQGGGNCSTDANTIWVEVNAKGFAHFDHGGGLDDERYYLPTPERLKQVNGNDWY